MHLYLIDVVCYVSVCICMHMYNASMFWVHKVVVHNCGITYTVYTSCGQMNEHSVLIIH